MGTGSHRHHALLRRHGVHTLDVLLLVCASCHARVHNPQRGDPDPYARRWLIRARDYFAAHPRPA